MDAVGTGCAVVIHMSDSFDKIAVVDSFATEGVSWHGLGMIRLYAIIYCKNRTMLLQK